MTIKWDKRYLEIAKTVSSWSKDPSTCVGAVLVRDGQIISQGYNGFPRGLCDEPGLYRSKEFKYQHIVHAEENCIYNAVYNNTPIKNSKIYITGLPICHNCAKVIIQCGIREVIIDSLPNKNWQESAVIAAKMLNECNVKYSIINIEKEEIKNVNFSEW